MVSIRIQHQPNFLLGLLYVLAGGGFAVGSLRYDMGQLSYMGPGYFPFLLGLLLAVIGTFIAARSLGIKAGSIVRLAGWSFRSIFWMVGSIMVFGFALQPLGLIISLVLLVVLASLASHDFSWRTTLVNAFVMVVLNVGGIAYGLSIPFPVLPEVLSTSL